jgi:hypothetical protein
MGWNTAQTGDYLFRDTHFIWYSLKHPDGSGVFRFDDGRLPTTIQWHPDDPNYGDGMEK